MTDRVLTYRPWYLTGLSLYKPFYVPHLCAFLVVRTQGIVFVRPEKSWRPIVSVSISGQHTHEVILGCDGQNPNLKTPFPLFVSIIFDLPYAPHIDITTSVADEILVAAAILTSMYFTSHIVKTAGNVT